MKFNQYKPIKRSRRLKFSREGRNFVTSPSRGDHVWDGENLIGTVLGISINLRSNKRFVNILSYYHLINKEGRIIFPASKEDHSLRLSYEDAKLGASKVNLAGLEWTPLNSMIRLITEGDRKLLFSPNLEYLLINKSGEPRALTVTSDNMTEREITEDESLVVKLIAEYEI